jgi:hypothetical protein
MPLTEFNAHTLQRFNASTLLLFALFGSCSSFGSPAEALFREGNRAYLSGDYALAARVFRASAVRRPASGTLQNLGSAEWQHGETGLAILAWEQALWLDPFNHSARDDLRFARREAQLEAPDLGWYEVVSTWLPVNCWAWITGASLWLAVGMVMLPGILRCRKASWHQAVAAFGLMAFLLSVPAHWGVHTRARIGFVLQKNTPLLLTPTADGQTVTSLGAGDPVRWERIRGHYVLVRTGHTQGWLAQSSFALTCPGE